MAKQVERNYMSVIGEPSVITIANKRYKHGDEHPFFMERNMDMWDTHIPYACIVTRHPSVDQNDISSGNVLFITADRSVVDKMKSMTIRSMNSDGDIANLSKFMEYKVLQEALDVLLHYARFYGVQLEAISINQESE